MKREPQAMEVTSFHPIFRWKKCAVCEAEYLWLKMWQITFNLPGRRPSNRWVCSDCKKTREEIEDWVRKLFEALRAQRTSGPRTITENKNEPH